MIHPGLRTRSLLIGLLTILLSGPAPGFPGNKSIRIDDGVQAGGQSTINGSIRVGSNATIDGSLKTVNGTIRVDKDTRLQNAETVNGSIHLSSGVTAVDVSSVNGSLLLGENVIIEGMLSIVNGKIETGAGSRVKDNVSNVNGELHLKGTEIGGNLSTVNGDVWLMEGSALHGDLVLEKSRDWSWGSSSSRTPRIIIGPGSSIGGTIRLQRKAELFISDSATVNGVDGVMTLADAVRFSGAKP